MGGGAFRLLIFSVVDWFRLERIERVVHLVRCAMLVRRCFDDVVAEALEVGRRAWDRARICHPIMESGKEMVVLSGGDVHHRRDARRTRSPQERYVTPDVLEVGHDDDGGGLGQRARLTGVVRLQRNGDNDAIG